MQNVHEFKDQLQILSVYANVNHDADMDWQDRRRDLRI